MNSLVVVEIIIVVLLNLLFSGISVANNKNPPSVPYHNIEDSQVIRVIALESPFLLSIKSNQQGAYNQFITQVKAQTHMPIDVAFILPKVAEPNFHRKRFDCVFPANINSMESDGLTGLIASNAFNKAVAYVYTAKDKPTIESINDLSNKVLSKRAGFDYGKPTFSESTNIVSVTSVKQSLGMLAKGRIDAFIAYEPDAIEIIKNNTLINVHRSASFYLHQQDEQIVCHDTPSTQQFIKQVNQSIVQLETSGKLAAILKLPLKDQAQNKYE